MSLVSAIALSACSVVGIRGGTETPRYTVLETHGPIEIRAYPARLAAETELPGSEYQARGNGFRRLAAYIFGANTPKAAIAMTAPVDQAQPSPGQWRIRFFLPATYTEATAPRPDNPAVRVTTLPAETVAVYRYTGSTAPAATATAARDLLDGLANTGWTATGQPAAWFYDPPWTLPFLRRNESVVPVARQP